MPDVTMINSEEILAEAKPTIRQRLIASLKKLGPEIKQTGAPALMGLFLGGIIAPLAALSAGPVAQLLTQIISGVGGNLLANFIQKFYAAENAGDEAGKQAVLAEIIKLLQTQSEHSAQMAAALQQLLERVDALAAVKAAQLPDETALIERWAGLRVLPADLPAHREFVRAVKKIFQLKRSAIAEGIYLGGEQLADLLVTDVIHGEPLRTVVQCVTTKQGRADEALRRLYRAGKISREKVNAAVQAWLGHVRHGDTWGLRKALFRQYTFSRAAEKS